MSKDTTVVESVGMKQQLEKDIFDLIVSFEKKTGLGVQSIHLKKEYVDYTAMKNTEAVEITSII